MVKTLSQKIKVVQMHMNDLHGNSGPEEGDGELFIDSKGRFSYNCFNCGLNTQGYLRDISITNPDIPCGRCLNGLPITTAMRISSKYSVPGYWVIKGENVEIENPSEINIVGK